ncbi:replication protein [Listeria sp. FSL L7-1582]|uniref:phage replisome organizer N-terminal domain-containing protein n=1 Tax=Listeria portnoyi TaxID=2713504 RepID=UPI00164E8A7A|nr:phage replisome organizer N-terminal domain-containing protein [Listeria portnoyi]MBC6310130.1 replication protein [Listeria portnoyi]
MAEITWIKFKTDMFEDEKIRLIESLPNCDTILVIWFKLLAQAGKSNLNGYIMLNEQVPLNTEELSGLFNRPLNDVRMAFAVLARYQLIEIENDIISIRNWEKHQNIEGMDKVRLQNKERNRKYRERKRQNLLPESDVTVTSHDGTDIDKELDKEKDKERDKRDIAEQKLDDLSEAVSAIVAYLNEKANKNYKTNTPATRSHIKARLGEGFTVDDFKKVIDIKTAEWLDDPSMQKFLRPITLFATKFESYLNQPMPTKGGYGNAQNNGRHAGSDEDKYAKGFFG